MADDPVAVSPTAQEFEGERYYLCGFYYQRNGRRLHVAVWEAEHGPRPPGHHIHHVDGDRSNNALTNLECKRAADHQSEHSRAKWLTSPAYRRNIERAREAARRWHRSAAARELHSANGRKMAATVAARAVTKTCEDCGATFSDGSSAHVARTCSRNCYARLWRRERRPSGQRLSAT